MSVNNLHSLLNGKWFIHEAYGKALLPSLFAMIDGKLRTPNPDAKKPAPKTYGRTGRLIAANGNAGSGAKADYVLIMDLKDPIYKYNQYCGPEGTKFKMEMLEYYKNDPACRGVVLDIDSGGGQVSGTPEFYDYLLNYGKPVVTYTDGYMCSAAYYIGSAGVWIVANKRADHIGSIGVMVFGIDPTGIYVKQGASVISEYATKSTEKNKDWEELLAGNPENYIKNQLDPLAETFHNDMKAVRKNLNPETLKGGTWDAAGALAMGLIDEIGTKQTAVNKVFELADQQSNNQNLDNMSTTHAKVQAVLGLDAPLALTENGSYLNAEQLGTLETALTTADANTAAVQTQLDAANTATTNAQTALTTAQTEHTAAVSATATQVDALVTAAGITTTGTTAEKLTALGAHYAAINKGDGATHTTIRTDNNPSAETPKYVDAAASHNQLADKIFRK